MSARKQNLDDDDGYWLQAADRRKLLKALNNGYDNQNSSVLRTSEKLRQEGNALFGAGKHEE